MIHEGLGSGAAVLSLAEPRGIFTRTSVAVTGLNFHPPSPLWLSNRFNIAARRRISRFRDIPLDSVSHELLSRTFLHVYCVIVAFVEFYMAGDARVRVLVIDQRDLLFVRGAWNNWDVVLKFLKRAGNINFPGYVYFGKVCRDSSGTLWKIINSVFLRETFGNVFLENS